MESNSPIVLRHVNHSMFSCRPFRLITKSQNILEGVGAREKTRRRTCGGEIEADGGFGIKVRESFSDAGFGCIIQPKGLLNA